MKKLFLRAILLIGLAALNLSAAPGRLFPTNQAGREWIRFAAQGYVAFAPHLFSRPGLAELLTPANAALVLNVSENDVLAALTDGEDFELLFTVASRDAVPLLDAWRKQFPQIALTCIGRIKAGEGITIRDKQGVRPLTAHGYVHFA